MNTTPWRRIVSGGRAPLIHSLTSALDGGEWSASRPSRFTSRERAPGTHWIGGWVGTRAVLDPVMKRKIPSPRRESNPRTPIVQPVAQRYTDWAITALRWGVIVSKQRRKWYEGVSKSFRTGRLERELQVVQFSATTCRCIAILWVSLVSFAAMTLCVAS
jgi:hypothetical protein